jgi:hypothetical protein
MEILASHDRAMVRRLQADLRWVLALFNKYTNIM